MIEKGKIKRYTSINHTKYSIIPSDYLHVKYGGNNFEKINYERIQTYYQDDDEDIWRTQIALDAWVGKQRSLDQLGFCNGNNEIVKVF